jgi:hypothetical protein
MILGPERKSRIPDEEANEITAYHEGGHTIVAFYTKDSHPLHKVTIIPRGPSLGHVCSYSIYFTTLIVSLSPYPTFELTLSMIECSMSLYQTNMGNIFWPC